MDVNKQILYITYDGLTDPLGQSQILPYLKGLSNYGYSFTILSFEKKDRYEKERKVIEQLTSESGIRWVPLWFTSKPPMLSKFYDALQLRKKAIELHRQYQFDMVHCRSYIAADVGLQLKKRFGIPFFFDMRGFWADEKKDGGSWKMDNPVFKRVYQYYKKKEKAYLQNADCVVSLTQAGKKELMTWESYNSNTPLQVIPCCADMDHFSITDEGQRKRSKKNLGIAEDALVISYLGSVGTWYMLDEMLLLFKKIKKNYPSARFLFVTHTDRNVIDEKISLLELEPADFIITQASRKEVPQLIKASDINISFIKPVYSKLSSSPTKLGEVLSMGIPVISNSGVGDVEQIIKNADAGYVLDHFSESDLENAVAAIPSLLKKSPEAIRSAVKDVYSLANGIQLYLSSYRQVLSK